MSAIPAAPPDQAMPAYVGEQLAFYVRATRTARWGYNITESASIAVAAAVPVAVAAGGPSWLTASLGGLAAVATGLGQAFHYRDNWITRSIAREEIKREIAVYLCGSPTAERQAELVAAVSQTSRAEAAYWKHVLGTQESDPPSAPPTEAEPSR